MKADRTDGVPTGEHVAGRLEPAGATLVYDLAAAGAFLAIASAMVLTRQVSIVLVAAILVGFGVYAAKFVPGVSYDGPSAPTLGLFFVAVGILLLG